jgi:hypothetical protein
MDEDDPWRLHLSSAPYRTIHESRQQRAVIAYEFHPEAELEKEVCVVPPAKKHLTRRQFP